MDFINVRPKIFLSECLGVSACRWNEQMINSRFVESLKNHVDIVYACPERDCGLGVPRDPVRIVKETGIFKLLQNQTELDCSQMMNEFGHNYINTLEEVDAFILKDRSPSCGLSNVKVYPGLNKSNVLESRSGFFAQQVIDMWPDVLIETEARLSNYTIREQFLSRLFSIARLRLISQDKSMAKLVEFHSNHKFLIMTFSEKQMRILGRIVANHDKLNVEQVYDLYKKNLALAFKKPAKYTANINVLMHIFGFFSDELNGQEKRFFLNTVEEYRREQIPFSVPLNLLQSMAIRFEHKYIEQQFFFEPYPKELMDTTDSGKGRK